MKRLLSGWQVRDSLLPEVSGEWSGGISSGVAQRLGG